jgi:hypothetical protein
MWKTIDGFNGFYSVSDDGRVRSNDRIVFNNGSNVENKINGKELKQYKNNMGYMYVDLCVDGKKKHYLVHRLVATAFIDNPCNHPIINHKDNNPLNNTVNNLEWCTYSYNNQYSHNQNRHPCTEKSLKARRQPKTWLHKPVVQYTKQMDEVQKFESITCAAMWLVDNGIMKTKKPKTTNIVSCCKGKAKSAYGFIWKYAE